MEFGCTIKKEHVKLNEKTFKIPLTFPTTYLYGAKFSPHTSTKITNAEADENPPESLLNRILRGGANI